MAHFLSRETRRAVRRGAGCGRQNRRLQPVKRIPETRANWALRQILAQSLIFYGAKGENLGRYAILPNA